MKAVLDTNVLMSAVFFGGVPGRILEAFRTGRIKLVYSAEIFEEYRGVAERLSKVYGELELGPILTVLATTGTLVAPEELPEPTSRDPDDDKFLACAKAGGAAVVVSGDADLLSIGRWEEISILTPRRFVDRYLKP